MHFRAVAAEAADFERNHPPELAREVLDVDAGAPVDLGRVLARQNHCFQAVPPPRIDVERDRVCSQKRRSPKIDGSAPPFRRSCSAPSVAPMQTTTEQLTTAPEATELVAAAMRAEPWAGEPFLHSGEDPVEVMAPGTARRRALDEAQFQL